MPAAGGFEVRKLLALFVARSASFGASGSADYAAALVVVAVAVVVVDSASLLVEVLALIAGLLGLLLRGQIVQQIP